MSDLRTIVLKHARDFQRGEMEDDPAWQNDALTFMSRYLLEAEAEDRDPADELHPAETQAMCYEAFAAGVGYGLRDVCRRILPDASAASLRAEVEGFVSSLLNMRKEINKVLGGRYGEKDEEGSGEDDRIPKPGVAKTSKP